jgi:hypothetical protein
VLQPLFGGRDAQAAAWLGSLATLSARSGAAALVAASTVGWAGLGNACDQAGIVSRIEGRPQDVVITRTESGAKFVVGRPRVLDVLCRNDVVHIVGTTDVVLSIGGSATVRVDHNIDYTVPARGGEPNALINALATFEDTVMPDMKRIPVSVRIKGLRDDFGFALPDLSAGGQEIRAGSRTLLVRLVGGTAPYKVEIRNAQDTVVASQQSTDREVVLPGVILGAGAYRLVASDASPGVIFAAFMAVDSGPPVDESFNGLSDAEIRSALEAATLARIAPATWTFEAEQQLEAAPVNGLDRDKVYELIESYSTQ